MAEAELSALDSTDLHSHRLDGNAFLLIIKASLTPLTHITSLTDIPP
jgi:hypothetical protein